MTLQAKPLEGQTKRVALVRPPGVTFPTAFQGAQAAPSLALALLGRVCEQNGYKATAIDAIGEAMDQFKPIGNTGYFHHGLSAQQIIERIPADAMMIGVSCMFSNEWIYHRIVINAVAEAFPDATVIVGGEHATAAPDYVLKSCPGVAACVLGEGEDTLLDLLNALDTQRPLTDVPGLFVRGEGDAHFRTAPRERIKDLDAMPLPQWDLVPIHTYLDRGAGHGVVGKRTMPMLASRGCPFKCTFCSNPVMWGKLWNARSPKLVVEEMKLYCDTYHAEAFSFYDLTAIVRKDWILEFTRLLEEADLNVKWLLPSGTRSEALDAEVVAAMKRTGCETIVLAPESGSESTLKRIKKHVNLEKMLATTRACAKEGVFARANIIVGFPDETWGDILQTMKYIVRMAWAGMHDVGVFPFSPYPGSHLHEELKARGCFPSDDAAYDKLLAGNLNSNYFALRSWNDRMSPFQLKLTVMSGVTLFYLCQYTFRPWRLLGNLRRLAAGTPVSFIERVGYNAVVRFARMLWPKRRTAAAPSMACTQGPPSGRSVHEHSG